MNEFSIGNDATLRGASAAVLARIDQYEVVRELGEGGFGAVYLARDTVAGIEVAIKGLPPEVKCNQSEMENVKSNFALVSRLHHPYIAAALHLHLSHDVSYADVTVRDRLRVTNGDPLLVMEYAPGVTLDRWRKQFPNGVVPLQQAADIAWQVAQALDFAHENRILHRDVKPANIMVETSPDGEIMTRLLDFGLAAEIRSSMGRVSREIRDTSGTRPYMAPEQWLGRRQTAAADQYALAAVLYEMILGEVPFASVFETGDPLVMMTVVANREVEIPLECPRRRSLAKALSKNAENRYPSCVEFLQDFAKSERPVEQKKAVPPPQHSEHRIKPKWIAFRAAQLVAAGLAAILLAIGSVAYLSYRKNCHELEELAARIQERRQTFISEYAKVDAYRHHLRTRGPCLSRIDDLYENVKEFVVSRNTNAARRQLQDLELSCAELQTGLAFLEKDEKSRIEEEKRKISKSSAVASAVRQTVAPAVQTPDNGSRATVVSANDDVLGRMKKMILPSVSFLPSATFGDAVSFFRQAGKDYDVSDRPVGKRGFNVLLDNGAVDGNVSIKTEIRLSNISFFDALSTVCDSCGFKFDVDNDVIRIKLVNKPFIQSVAKAKSPDRVKTFNREEETLAAKRCAMDWNWRECYKHLVHADTNDCEIMYLFGACLSTMHPDKKCEVQKNDRMAFNWFLRGAKRGDAPCRQNLGDAYRKGLGRTKDIELALYWIKLAAEQQNPDAVCSLAEMFEKGEGVAKDPEKAADLYSLAAQKNVAKAVTWVRDHKATDRYKKMIAKHDVSARKNVQPTAAAPVASYSPRPRRSFGMKNYDSGWYSPGGSASSVSAPSSGKSDAAVWGSVLGGVLTGLAIGLTAIR